MKKDKKVIKVSGVEREILREIVRSEKANIRVFNLQNKSEHNRYERTLQSLDNKLS
ncbi:MAG: hypothetical protein M1400_00635 [Patescibacteria group bacterium]|nr:hypothetical protein [Patescibacteria group bacterium]